MKQYEKYEDIWLKADSHKVIDQCKHWGTQTIEDCKPELSFAQEMWIFHTASTLMELGAGAGRFIPVFRELKSQVYMIEWNEDIFNVLQTRVSLYNNIVPIYANILDRKALPYAQLAFCSQVIHWMPTAHANGLLSNIAHKCQYCLLYGYNDNMPSKVMPKHLRHDYKKMFAAAKLKTIAQGEIEYPNGELNSAWLLKSNLI